MVYQALNGKKNFLGHEAKTDQVHMLQMFLGRSIFRIRSQTSWKIANFGQLV